MKFKFFILFILIISCSKEKTVPEEYRNNWALYYINVDEDNILENISNSGYITNLMVINKSNKLYINNHQNKIKIYADIFFSDKKDSTVVTISNSSDKRLDGIYKVNLKKETKGRFHTYYMNLKSETVEFYAEKRTN